MPRWHPATRGPGRPATARRRKPGPALGDAAARLRVRRRVLVLLLGLALGCATPEDRYRVLSVFFDDVPVPESLRPPPPPPGPEPLPEQTPESLPARVASADWVVHDPDCDECHSSEVDKRAYLPAPQLCWECHDEEDYADRVAHGPFSAGACLQCHSPHKSQNPTLLLAALPQLCEKCHDATTFPELTQHRAKDGEDCIGCHDPHAAAGEYMMQGNRGETPGVSAAVARGAVEPVP